MKHARNRLTKRGRLFRRERPDHNAAPDAIGKQREAQATVVRRLDFLAEGLRESSLDRGTSPAIDPEGPVTWIEVEGLLDAPWITDVAKAAGLPDLLLSDALHGGQRPKLEIHDDGVFAVLRTASLGDDGLHSFSQVSLWVTERVVLTLSEGPHPHFEGIRGRVRSPRSRLRGRPADHLFAELLGAVIDGFYPILEAFASRLEDLEDRIVARPHEDTLRAIYTARRELSRLRRAVWPMRGELAVLLREPPEDWSEPTEALLRNTNDHTVQIADLLESYRELAGSFIEVYLSNLGHRTNEVMRLLTVVTTLFIPLTFLAGLYGMNFDTSQPANMPELSHPYGYPTFLLVCLLLAIALGYVFWRIGWLTVKRTPLPAARDEEETDPPGP